METQNKWVTYTLTATKNGVTKTYRFSDVDDTEAIYTALFTVLDRAGKLDRHGVRTNTADIWATGRIELSRGGEIVRVMEAK